MMAKDQRPDFSCATNSTHHSVTNAPCRKLCKVSYRFVFQSKLSLPYAVAVDGVVLSMFKDRPKRTDGKITLTANAGQKVQLYLNSDAHPDHRQHPVYPVAAGEDDVDVVITEVPGKQTDTDLPILGDAKRDPSTGRTTQNMSAKLTGDIWMKVSHRYAPDEVNALLPQVTSAEVAAGVRRIYEGLATPTLIISRSGTEGASNQTLTVKFIDSDNPKANINNYSLLKDGLPRVHPGGYAALFSAALAHGIESLQVTSCWRPMLGSIAHRAGLGLDVGYVGATPMNRQELRLGKVRDTSNVSDEEVRLFRAFESSIVADKRADTELIRAKEAAALSWLNPEQRIATQQRVNAAAKDKMEAAKTRRKANDAWDIERNANEPATVKLFRKSLLGCPCVSQLFDPWYMDANTKDQVDPEPNMQRPLSGGRRGLSNEELHAHHLHVTVYEPKIL